MNQNELLKNLAIVQLKNEKIANQKKQADEKEEYKSLFEKYKNELEKKEKENKKLKELLEKQNTKIKLYEENINKLPNVVKKIWLRGIILKDEIK